MPDTMDFTPEEMLQQEQTEQATDKKCVQCGGTMRFDPGASGLRCPYCDHTQEIEAAGVAEELDFSNAESVENCDWGAAKKTIICKSCGAESIYDELQLSNECPYCGSTQVMERKDVNTLAPGGVCIFKLDAKRAGENFHSWIRKKWFCPRLAKQKARPDAFRGVYLPYWTFDSQTSSQYTARYGIDRTVRDSDGKTHTKTDWYNTSGHHAEFIDDQLVLGTSRHDPGMMSRIEPFNTADNLAYKPEYVAGFISERYSVGLKSAWERGRQLIAGRLNSSISSKIRREKHADHVADLRVSTTHSNITYKYLLLPIWLSSFTFKGKIYQFMVNGQTGKVGGKTPISALRVLIAVGVGILILWLIFRMTQ